MSKFKPKPATPRITETAKPLIGGSIHALALYKWFRSNAKEASTRTILDGEIIPRVTSEDFTGEHAEKALKLEPVIQVTIKDGVPASDVHRMLKDLSRKLAKDEKAAKAAKAGK